MNAIPPYKKWFDASGIVPAVAASTLTEEEPVQPGQIITFGGDDRSQAPPTNGESFSLSAQVFIPMGVNEQGMPTPIHAQLQLSYTVEDWGTASVDGNMVMNFTTATAAPTGPYGGHTAWGGSRCVPVSSGMHSLGFTYTNITMPDADMNQIVCVYSYRAVELEPGGKKEPQPCSSCNGSSCTAEGGQPPVTRSSGNSAAATSSAGSAVTTEVTEDSMLWSCNVGTLRGLGALLTGKVQLYADSFDSSLTSPAALFFNHPMLAALSLPEGGLVPGTKAEIRIGDRVIALRYYQDGSIAPIGVDSAGKGLVSLTQDSAGSVTALKWQDNSGAAWVFDGTSGALLSYTSPEQVSVSDVSDYLIVNRHPEDDSLRQIWSLWDGLLNIEDISDSGYAIRLYTAEHITDTDASGFFIPEPGTAFKTFTVSGTENSLTIVEKTPGREDYACTWSMGEDGAWSLVQGAAAEAVTTSRVRTTLEPDPETEVWQLVTTVSRGGVTASCICEVYQNSPMGALLLTRVVGYGTPEAQTTAYEYDGVGNLLVQTAPNGHRTEYQYDLSGRVQRTIEPWRAGGCTLITEYSYAYSSDSRYSAELASVTRWLRQPGASSLLKLSTESHTYSTSEGLRRETIRTTATGSSHTHTEISETWTDAAPIPLHRGRLHMTQSKDGIQTLYSYAATSDHGSIYSITTETQVEGNPVPGQSRRTVRFINAAGNTVREEVYHLLSSGTWAKLSGVNHSYDTQNRLCGSVRDNGRSSSQALSCTGDVLWEIDEDGIRTDYTYDSARCLTEISRAAVYDGDTCITPETITEFVRDAAGRVTSTITRTGAMTATRSTVYDAAGRTIATTDELGRTTTTAYSADGLTTTVTTPSGATLITTRNTDGSVAHVSGTGQRELYHVYDVSGSNLRETVKLGDNQTTLSQSITNGFDELITEAVASVSGFIYTRSEYNAKGQLTKQYQDAGWNTTPTAATLFEYDTMGNVSKKTLALAEAPDETNSPTEVYAYGAESLEDGIYSVLTRTRFNAAGAPLISQQKQLISSLSSSIESKSISVSERNLTSAQWSVYNAATKRTRYTSLPSSDITAASVSVDGFVISQSDNAGVTTTAGRAYTASGMTITHTDSRGNNTTTVTDTAGRTLSVTNAAGNTTTTTYDPAHDLPATVTDAQGNTTCYRYDERGRKVAEWGTGIQPAIFAYDAADRMTSLTTFRASTETVSTDPVNRTDGDVTTWSYHDTSGMEIRKSYADGSSITRTYDAYNRVLTETDARGKVKTHTYEHARGLLQSTSYSDSTTPRAYTYNHLGQLTQVTDAAGTRTLSYNSYGEQESDSLAADSVTHLITENRDELGRSSGYTYAKNASVQQTVTTDYGSDGRISSAGFIHGGAQKMFGYTYLPGTHLLQTLTKPNNMSLTLSYETQRDLLTGMAYKRGSTTVASRAYTYDSLARPTARSTARNAQTVNDTFGYNSRSELMNATVNGALHGYDYDNIGNRTQAIEGQTSGLYAANCLNQYTSIHGYAGEEEYSFSPAFDTVGNQTLVKTATGIWSITYDAENRPVSFTNTETNTVMECSYDYMGRRATKKVTVNGVVTLHHRYLYRGYLQIACCDLTRSNHPALWLITWDPTQPIATRPLAIQKDGTWYTYGWDLTKNICELYGINGYIRTTYTYTPYGAVTISGDVTQPIQWSSEFHDDELALVYYNYRHYNPTDGRWLGRDFVPMNEELNIYDFLNNDPLQSFDIWGLKTSSTTKVYSGHTHHFDDDISASYQVYIEASCSTDGKPKVNLIHVAIYPPFDKESTVLSYRQTPSSSPHSVEVSIPINLYYTQTSLIGNITGYGGIGAGLVSFKINNIWTTLGSFLISLIGFYSTSEEKYIFHHYHKFTVNCKCAPTRVWIRGTERYIEEERWNAFVEDRTIEV